MDVPKGFFSYLIYSILFLPVFLFLFLAGIIKGAIISPFVFLVIAIGDSGVVISLWPLHLVWSIYCLVKTKRFGPYMKCLLILLVPISTALWIVIGVGGSAIMGAGYAFIWPIMETFKGISVKGPVHEKMIKCIVDGTWTCVLRACTIVRDFADFSFHSYFSVMDGLLEPNEGEMIELKIAQIPGCALVAILGILVDVPVITFLVLFKAPILLLKGWHRLMQDLIGRAGPFLETVCVPFAGFSILLWPIIVVLLTILGIFSSFGFGCYAAVVAYQENSTWMGLLYVVASVSIFDEYTNDMIYLREGSCFPRPRYRKRVSASSSMLPNRGLHQQIEAAHIILPIMRAPADKANSMQAAEVWDKFFESFEETGKELLRSGAIGLPDLEAWENSKSKIINIGIPAYAFLDCFLLSIRSGSDGFILRDSTVITSLIEPEGLFFDCLYEPMCIMKEQIRNLKLEEHEELYFYKHCLYGGDKERIQSLLNGGIPPADAVKRAQLEGISRRLRGFCLTLSRLPTSRRLFFGIAEAIKQEALKHSNPSLDTDIEANK